VPASFDARAIRPESWPCEVRPSELSWTGTTLGIRVTHAWRGEPQAGGSRISIEETWEGLMGRLFRRSFQTRLDDSCRDGLEAIKREAERLAAVASRTRLSGVSLPE
jgi:hypothetical protein